MLRIQRHIARNKALLLFISERLRVANTVTKKSQYRNGEWRDPTGKKVFINVYLKIGSSGALAKARQSSSQFR
jgi:hypothetical protein